MLGKWLRTTSRTADSADGPAPAPAPEPTDDELATVLALLVVSDHDVRMIMERTGFPADLAVATVNELGRRNVVSDAGGDFFTATQGYCAGPCRRGGHELRGQEIVITPPRFEWECAHCRDSEPMAPPGAA